MARILFVYCAYNIRANQEPIRANLFSLSIFASLQAVINGTHGILFLLLLLL